MEFRVNSTRQRLTPPSGFLFSKLILKFCRLVKMVCTFKGELFNFHAFFKGHILCFSKQINILDLRTLDSLIQNEYETIEYQNKQLDGLKKHCCYTFVAHLNTHSLRSSSDEFSYLMNPRVFINSISLH